MLFENKEPRGISVPKKEVVPEGWRKFALRFVQRANQC